ncbi:hypothetical protein HDN1F_37750 [gamma proteobacterium HdN1]|nr:hypothetical protein HDN1F_37750 [gamma proteobacterium HdN1]
MRNSSWRFLLMVPMILLLAGCHGLEKVSRKNELLMVSGYGTADARFRDTAQRDLMGLRASRVDAYRNLVERVKGVNVFGTTSVDTLMGSSDAVRLSVNAYLRGARVMSQTKLPDGRYETIVSLQLTEYFFESLMDSRRNHSKTIFPYGGDYSYNGERGTGASTSPSL